MKLMEQSILRGGRGGFEGIWKAVGVLSYLTNAGTVEKNDKETCALPKSALLTETVSNKASK